MKKLLILIIISLCFGGSAFAYKGTDEAEYKKALIFFKAKDYGKALPHFKTAAEQGHTNAQYALATLYFEGKGTDKDIDKAVKWHLQAGRQGHSNAQLFLGDYYLEKDRVESIKWYKKALAKKVPSAKERLGMIPLVDKAFQGDPEAQYKIGLLYIEGKALSKDTQKGIDLIRKSADQGNPKAHIALSISYLTGYALSYMNNKEAGNCLRSALKQGAANEKLGSFEDSDLMKIIKEQATQGDAEAQCAFGVGYEKGVSAPEKNLSKAVDWVRKSAEQDHAKAQCILGSYYIGGVGLPKDTIEGLKWIMKSAEQGLPEAQVVVGISFEYGEGVQKDLSKAVEWYKKAVQQTNTVAMCHLALCYKNGIGVKKDLAESVKWYKKSAEQGNEEAQYQLALCYENGIGVEKDLYEAVKWYKKSAEQGNAAAQVDIGASYQHGIGIEKDLVEAAKWYTKSAEQGNAVAQLNLGYCYLEGKGVEKDSSKAISLFKSSAEKGFLLAKFNLGVCYFSGIGVEKDEIEGLELIFNALEKDDAKVKKFLDSLDSGYPKTKTAFIEWVRKLSEEDNSYAQYKLGNYYLEGFGVPVDLTRAVELYKKSSDLGCSKAKDKLRFLFLLSSAEQGDSDAQLKLGTAYATGEFGVKDIGEALKWIEKSASQDNLEAMYSMGLLYENGWVENVQNSEDIMLMWFKKAAEKGYAKAQFKFGWYTKSSEEFTNFWIDKAADQGYAEAQFQVGKHYMKSHHTWNLARIWLTKAAEQGHAEARKMYYSIPR